MAHQWLRTNLAVNIFPLATSLQGRTVIVPGLDENYERVNISASDTSADKGIPSANYMHNCMPTPHGYQAISYDRSITAMPPGTVTDFDQCFGLQDVNLVRVLFVPAAGKNYIFDGNVGNWKSVDPISVPAGTLVTVAFVAGQSYFYYDQVGCFKYNPTTQAIDAVAFTGVNGTGNPIAPGTVIHGVCAAYGYMVVWNDVALAWSSILNATDFTPSLITGAGGGNLLPARGKILFCLPIANGFIVYCEKNTISATYTGNAQFPWTFKEIEGSGGCVDPNLVSYESNFSFHYAWTTLGLQQLSAAGAELVFPEITQFLTAKIYEDFEESTLTFSLEKVPSQLNVKLTLIGAEYLVISYGKPADAPDFTYAVVLDVAYQRWGKLKIVHRDVFQWNSPNLAGFITYGELQPRTYQELQSTTYGQLGSASTIFDIPKKILSILQKDGTTYTVNFDLMNSAADGVLMLGKFQWSRSRNVQHQRTDVENVEGADSFNLYVISTWDGKTLLTPVPATVLKQSAESRLYGKWIEGYNFNLLFTGCFNLTSVITDISMGGTI